MQSSGGLSVIECLEEVRQQLKKRGNKTIRGLGRVFRQMDSFDGNHKVDRQEFITGLRDCQVNLTNDQFMVLYEALDKNNDGCVDFDEFLVAIRGKPNARRQAVIDKAFLKFDKDCSGSIDANDLRGVYSCKFHPKVQEGKMTEDQVFMEFLQNFGDTNKDGTLTRQEWNEYYAAVSSSIDNDDHFVQLMNMAWKL